MPKHTDIKPILFIGSGPIMIGQACGLGSHGLDVHARRSSAAYRPLIGSMLQVS
jgi:hypothetical protein